MDREKRLIDLEVNELKRFNDMKDDWELVSDFIKYLEVNNVVLAEQYGPERLKRASAPLKTMLADYFEVDLIQVAKEKEELVNHYLKEILDQE